MDGSTDGRDGGSGEDRLRAHASRDLLARGLPTRDLSSRDLRGRALRRGDGIERAEAAGHDRGQRETGHGSNSLLLQSGGNHG